MEQGISEKSNETVNTAITANAPKKRNNVLNTGWWPVFYFVLFFVVFLGVYIYIKPVAKDVQNEIVLGIFTKYSRFAGAIFGFLSMVAADILYGVKRLIFKFKYSFINPMILAGVTLPWFLLARQLVNFEKRYTDVGRGVITYLGLPLWYSAIIFFGLATIWFVVAVMVSFKKTKI